MAENVLFNLSILEKNLELFEKMYDLVRVVDPVQKKIFNYKKGYMSKTDSACYMYWRRNHVCENCIAMRAYIENDTFIKMEYKDGNIFMITAIPINLEDRVYILELLKNVTKSLLVEGNEYQLTTDMSSIVKNIDFMAVKDSVTGLFNRRFINEKLPVEIFNSILSENHISVIMADIDDFKSINDIYGHLAGDYVLKEFSKCILSCIRNEKDWVARYGGDEFLICLTDSDHETAFKIAERMRKHVEDMKICFDGASIKITASFGFYTTHKEKISAESFIDLADKNLYLAKNNGRNRVEPRDNQL